MDHAELVRRLTIDDPTLDVGAVAPNVLPPPTAALIRLAVLVALGATKASYGAQIDEAIAAGLGAEELVEVLVAVAPLVGRPRVVAAAPRIAVALGLEPIEGWGRPEEI